ncbi:putative membrane protein [Rhodopirellula sallentina SM41]|uniref:Putative membrane protein n=2 Tax=Rhodopirellula TaxID=265488 RepID=M5TY55_9BACT|nr:putative membrane protein [Rhodopirellula sallentina SM41]
MASMSALVGFIIAGPGIAYLTSDMNRRMAAGRRYATYDPELYLFGISIAPATAQLLAFCVAPLLMALSAFLVYRGVKHRRHIVVDGNTD